MRSLTGLHAGEDISTYFTNNFTVVRPVRRVNVDLTPGMLRQLDERAARLNISRQAVIKTLLGRALQEERTAHCRTRDEVPIGSRSVLAFSGAALAHMKHVRDRRTYCQGRAKADSIIGPPIGTTPG